MKGRHSITINGRAYDAISGMPLANTPAHQQARPAHIPVGAGAKPQPHRAFSDIAMPRSKVASPAVHKQLQHSRTLYREALQRPAAKPATTTQPAIAQRSPAITKFGSLHVHPMTTPAAPVQSAADIAPAKPPVHPVVAKALASLEQRAPEKPEPVHSSKELKELLIKERLAEVDTADAPRKKHRSWFRRQPKLTTILTSTLAILLLGGYLTYINLPNISMRVAATRAGIAATFPSYNPDGYSFRGPITYSPGEVAVDFKSNTNNQNFTVDQKASNWDSQAVLDNLVNKETDSYLTYQQQGLTIYAFNNKAAWVNGGLLYTIEGSATLSSDQILHIATSM